MGDVNTNWKNPAFGDVNDMSGQLPTSRGSDPLFDLSGTSGLTASPFSQGIVPVPGGEETGNSVSGLPLQPNRYQPSEAPPGPPSLDQRSPTTIDQK